MRISRLVLFASSCAVLAGCSGDDPVSSRIPGQRFAVNSTRTVWVDAETYWTGFGLGSGGYVKGLATPVSSGTSYVMGDVEADGSSGAEFVEQTGYTGQLDAFKYDSSCTFKWYAGVHQVSTAGTIYLANYPTATSFTLQITCPSN